MKRLFAVEGRAVSSTVLLALVVVVLNTYTAREKIRKHVILRLKCLIWLGQAWYAFMTHGVFSEPGTGVEVVCSHPTPTLSDRSLGTCFP